MVSRRAEAVLHPGEGANLPTYGVLGSERTAKPGWPALNLPRNRHRNAQGSSVHSGEVIQDPKWDDETWLLQTGRPACATVVAVAQEPDAAVPAAPSTTRLPCPRARKRRGNGWDWSCVMESQGQTNSVFKDYLPGSSDLPEQNKPVEPTSLWKQTSHTHNLPPGLEYLNQLDRIIIHQQVELLEAILGTETSSKYEIKNHLGQRVYFAVEENGCFDRNLCSPIRSFTIRIADNTGREVITVNRPLRCNSCWFPCFLQELEVQSPPGTIAGYVVQNWDPFLPKFTIQNESKEDVLKIIGPYATCGCFEDVDFEVKALNEMSTIGKISKYWSGFVNNVFTNTANFGIQVPVDLDVRIKAVMIGACFLIDLMFFENSLDGL
ncbi:PREDICTED: phospholipid scramblase family member 5 [Charadrius vociferus]|nr:PREDICTED: phospholipid scramblase family member 5 [Charadrius vociferus]